jgi:SAM-dependent methyltransferase
MATSMHYTEDFFRDRLSGSLSSARRVVPMVVELIGCRSVVDVGCGLGCWLAAFREQNINDVRGVDGDYVNKSQLVIPQDCFQPADLSKPLTVDRRFDLAVSLEVAEHLPPETSGAFVNALTGFSPVVLFSGSLPFQDGTNHINEHWLEYWVELFRERGYRAVDCLRSRFWNDPEVDWWYAQNMMIFVSEQHLDDYPRLAEVARTTQVPVSLVHPKFLAHKQSRLQQLPRLTELWKSTLRRTWVAIASRLSLRSRSPK